MLQCCLLASCEQSDCDFSGYDTDCMVGIYEHADCNLLSYDAVFSGRKFWTEILVFYILTYTAQMFFPWCSERMCCLCLHQPHIHNSVTMKMRTARCFKTSGQTFIIHVLRIQKIVSPATPALKACKLMLLQNWQRGIGLLLPAAEYISTPDIGSSLIRHVCNYRPECRTRRPKSIFCPHECNLTASQKNCCWRLVRGTHSCDR
jgi:hypothetical protein